MYKIKSPVLLMIFNRPDTTQLVFEQIRKGKPDKLYIAADGARDNKEEDRRLCQQTRDLIKVDWDCEVRTLFREENLGCGAGPHAAISWFFDNVSQGIILEDDCLPLDGFFKFCDEMLDYYADDNRFYEISGTNLQAGKLIGEASYYFSNYGGIWGWASWSRAWKNYDYKMTGLSKFIEENQIAETFMSKKQQKYWNNLLPTALHQDVWDYQWLYTIWKNKGICIVPNHNLIKNIGFNSNATHTALEPTWYSYLTSNDKIFKEIIHPPIDTTISTKADMFQFNRSIYTESISQKIRNLLKKIF